MIINRRFHAEKISKKNFNIRLFLIYFAGHFRQQFPSPGKYTETLTESFERLYFYFIKAA